MRSECRAEVGEANRNEKIHYGVSGQWGLDVRVACWVHTPDPLRCLTYCVDLEHGSLSHAHQPTRLVIGGTPRLSRGDEGRVGYVGGSVSRVGARGVCSGLTGSV